MPLISLIFFAENAGLTLDGFLLLSRYGSVVVIFTHIGELTLDGDAMFFHESIAGAFSRAGLRVDSNGRRLLGIVEIIGMFNLLASAFTSSSIKDDDLPQTCADSYR